MKPLSVGVIGAGNIVRQVHLPVLLSMPNVSVRWIYDSNTALARSLGHANGIRAVDQCSPNELPDCDVALIAIPVGVRAAYFDVFAARRTAVFAEKPFAVAASDHRSLTERFESHRLACGYMRRFYSATQIMRRLVQTRPFGRLVRVRISEGNRSTGSNVDRSYLDDSRLSASGGILSELGCHSLDIALYLTGARSYETLSCEFIFDGHVDRKISASIKLAESKYFPEPTEVQLDYCVSWLDRQTNTITLEFENCTVWAQTQPGAQVHMGSPGKPSEAVLIVPAARAASTANQAFFLQWESFLDGVRTNTESDVSARSALLGTSLIEELYALGRYHA